MFLCIYHIYYCSYISICVFIVWHWPSGKRCQDSAVKKVTPAYRLDDPGFDSWKMQEIFSPACTCTPPLPQPTPSEWVLETLSPGTTQLWHEADHSPLSTATIKTVCSFTSSHPTCPHGMHSDNFYHLESASPKSKIVTQQQNTVMFISYSARLT
jgi:hypothetical protein